MAEAPIIIAGHSHVFAFQFGSTAVHNPPGLIPLPMPRENVYGFATTAGPYQPSYWDELVEQAAGKTILLFWLGSQHLAEFLFEHEEPFDFILAQRPELPLQETARLVPEALVREYQASFLAALGEVLDRLVAQPGCRIFLGATAPPKGDDAELRSFMMAEPFFQQQAASFGLDLATARFTPPTVRLKLWLTIQDLVQDIARARGVPYVPVPPSTQDEHGFLLREFWDWDVGHANHAYGLVFFDAARTQIDQSSEANRP
ncbi:hypothetical protein [Plastoroseomonas hellenica]|uniref:hypothetical protein n=1 Tax=Plastoroseomonas hellenica TaxID=2687306 RepID=UPI001BA88DB1|nr:hypothetical protein [Plastoroseomonas hellenica]MBR0644715.1 hypothetical protein [Plastoroseomonas hellenica]